MRILVLAIFLLAPAYGSACPADFAAIAPRPPQKIRLYKGKKRNPKFEKLLASLREGDSVEFGDGATFKLGERLYGVVGEGYGIAFALQSTAIWIPFEPSDEFQKINEALAAQEIPTVTLYMIGNENQYYLISQLPKEMIPVKDLFTPEAASMVGVSPEQRKRMEDELVAYGGATHKFTEIGENDVPTGLHFHPAVGWVLREYRGKCTHYQRADVNGFGVTAFTYLYEELPRDPHTSEVFTRMRRSIQRRREMESGKKCVVDLGVAETLPNAQRASAENTWDALGDEFHIPKNSIELQDLADKSLIVKIPGTFEVQSSMLDGGRWYDSYRLDRDWEIRVPTIYGGLDAGRRYDTRSRAVLATREKLAKLGVPVVEMVTSRDGKDYVISRRPPDDYVDLERLLLREKLDGRSLDIARMEEDLDQFAAKAFMLEETLDFHPSDLVYFPGEGWKLMNWTSWIHVFTPATPSAPGTMPAQNLGFSLFDRRLENMILLGREDDPDSLFISATFARLRRITSHARESHFKFACPVVTGQHTPSTRRQN